VLLGYLPPDPSGWDELLARKRTQYLLFCEVRFDMGAGSGGGGGGGGGGDSGCGDVGSGWGDDGGDGGDMMGGEMWQGWPWRCDGGVVVV
jgi:hypothetical protein